MTALTYATERVKVDSLKPCPYNPRTITKTVEAGLRSSIERFGLVQPLVINKRNMTVVGGNQRLRVIKGMGFKEVDVVFVDLEDKEEKFLNLTLNNRGITGDYTSEVLSLIDELMDSDIEMYDELRIFEIEKDFIKEQSEEEKKEQEENGQEDRSAEAEINEKKAALDLYEHYDYIVIATRDYRDFQWLVSFFDIKQEMDRITQKVGIGRGIKAADAIKKIQAAIENAKKDAESDGSKDSKAV